MSFRSLFEQGVAKLNKRAENDTEIRDILSEYAGRSIVVKVKDDDTYVFHISADGMTLDASSKEQPEDMYLETSKEILQTMIEEKRVDPVDLLLGKIKWKNIGLKEVSLVRKVLGI